MRLLVTETCAIRGIHTEAGSSIVMDDKDAQDLIAMGKAVRQETDRSVGLKSSDGAKPARRKKK